MRATARPRPGELREQMCGVASVIACLAYGSNDRKLAAISAALSYLSHPGKQWNHIFEQSSRLPKFVSESDRELTYERSQ